MLFDLRGKRRRTVQVTYAALAVLLGVGLVGFGVGSGTSGGISDIFGGGNGGSSGNSAIEKKVKHEQLVLQRDPKNLVALAAVVRYRYEIAAAQSDQRTGQFTKDGKKALITTSDAWHRYLAANPKKPDTGLASQMVVAYSPTGLNKPSDAAQAAEIVASARNDAQAYLQLVQYAAAAGQTRKADLAGQRAIQLAPKAQRKVVEQAVKQAKTPQGAAGGGQSAPPSGGQPTGP